MIPKLMRRASTMNKSILSNFKQVIHIKKEDYRKARMKPHDTHLHLVWFHWSWRPRLYICYFDNKLNAQRHKSLDFSAHGKAIMNTDKTEY